MADIPKGMQMALLHSMLATQEHARQSPSVDDLTRTVVDAVPTILCDARRLIEIGEDDVAHQAVKNLSRRPEAQKETLLTKEELAELRARVKEATRSYTDLIAHLDRLAELKATGRARQTERAVKKKAVKLLKRHCEHCAGKAAPCGCSSGCARREDLACLERHCAHCNGAASACGCKVGCPRRNGLSCTPRHCPHCKGRRGLCACVSGCERGGPIMCVPRTTASEVREHKKKGSKARAGPPEKKAEEGEGDGEE